MVRFIIEPTNPKSLHNINLHSNMVRFIMSAECLYDFLLYAIYIPIWLDLLSILKKLKSFRKEYLHSNMVRFIILNKAGGSNIGTQFTFQYG